MNKQWYPLYCVVWNYLSIPKLQRLHRWSLGMEKWFHPTLYRACDYLSILELYLVHVCRSGPWYQIVLITVLKTRSSNLFIWAMFSVNANQSCDHAWLLLTILTFNTPISALKHGGLVAYKILSASKRHCETNPPFTLQTVSNVELRCFLCC